MKRLFSLGCALCFFLSVSLMFVSCSTVKPGTTGKTGEQDREKLEQKIENLTRKLERSGKRQDALEEEIGMLNRRVRELSDQQGAKSPSGPNRSAGDFTEPSLLYKKGRNLMLEERFEKASHVFTEFLKSYPGHRLADNAMYWLGECHYSMGEFNVAADTFLALVERYPDGMKVPDALLKAGYSFLAVDDVNRGHHYLKQVVKKFPFTKAADKAESKLKTIN